MNPSDADLIKGILNRDMSAFDTLYARYAEKIRSRLQRIVREVPASPHIVKYAVTLARSTRPDSDGAPDFVNKWVAWGAGPRAGQYLILGGKARAITRGRYAVNTEDIRAVCPSVLRHRVLPNFNAEAEGVTPDQIIDWLIREVPREETTELKEAGADSLLRG